MTDGDRNDELTAVESELGVSLPGDYREFILRAGSVDRDFGGSWLMLYRVAELVPLNRAYDRSGTHPGLVFIGSDGGGEGVGFDFRSTPPRVVLVNWISAGWADALHQADNFTDFMAQRTSGQDYKFG